MNLVGVWDQRLGVERVIELEGGLERLAAGRPHAQETHRVERLLDVRELGAQSGRSPLRVGLHKLVLPGACKLVNPALPAWQPRLVWLFRLLRVRLHRQRAGACSRDHLLEPRDGALDFCARGYIVFDLVHERREWNAPRVCRRVFGAASNGLSKPKPDALKYKPCWLSGGSHDTCNQLQDIDSVL